MHLLRKILVPLLVCGVLASLWLVAADRGSAEPTVMRPDGSFVYDVVASRDDHRPSFTDDTRPVLRMVRSLVSG